MYVHTCMLPLGYSSGDDVHVHCSYEHVYIHVLNTFQWPEMHSHYCSKLTCTCAVHVFMPAVPLDHSEHMYSTCLCALYLHLHIHVHVHV